MSDIFKIYPNPATTILNVDLSIDQGKLKLYNPSGQRLLVEDITSSHMEIKIDLLINGVYLIKVIDDDYVSIGKFIKK